ncbi:hypothetical protein Bphy_5200 [Paraburkholderia phymatum STM815]|uniref:Zinc-ribbon domain-containing protein n=1 Tax=Paraburkholderia phymatum (strain DSM 17167 / CIP 108236 / LMG 21445 / STM815) TaxID=391038 RepID=B2JME8_PARP8|nr:hypothetical protein Bphy_5200 [Paraburkholderia phymatum STM815]
MQGVRLDCGAWDVTGRKGRSGVRLSLGDMQAMAQARGGRCLSTEYRNTQTKLRWQCGEGHIWEAAPAGLRTYGSWCPQCAFDRLRLKIGDMQVIARGRGGECLSERYVNNETKLRWRCAKGHEWDAKPMQIRRRSPTQTWRARRRKSRARAGRLAAAAARTARTAVRRVGSVRSSASPSVKGRRGGCVRGSVARRSSRVKSR